MTNNNKIEYYVNIKQDKNLTDLQYLRLMKCRGTDERLNECIETFHQNIKNFESGDANPFAQLLSGRYNPSGMSKLATYYFPHKYPLCYDSNMARKTHSLHQVRDKHISYQEWMDNYCKDYAFNTTDMTAKEIHRRDTEICFS